jgi:hypothetical protein
MIYKKSKRGRKLEEFISLIGFFIITVTVIVYTNKQLKLETNKTTGNIIESNYIVREDNKGQNSSDSKSSKSIVNNERIDKTDKYINSVLNIPNIVNENKNVEKTINDKIKGDVNLFFEENYKEAKDNFVNNNLDGVKFEANTDFEVEKNTDSILSLKMRYYNYSGGAHGFYDDIAYNIDIRSGKFLELSDLFLEQSNYKDIINNEIKSQIKSLESMNKEIVGIYQFNTIKENQKYYFNGNNIVLYFDLYDIAPYAAGIPEFTINSDILMPIVKKEYVDLFK